MSWFYRTKWTFQINPFHLSHHLRSGSIIIHSAIYPKIELDYHFLLGPLSFLKRPLSSEIILVFLEALTYYCRQKFHSVRLLREPQTYYRPVVSDKLK